MSDGTAVAEPPVEAPAQPKDAAPQRKPAPKHQPTYALIVENDDDHTFEYVIDVLMRVCRHGFEQAFLLTRQVHTAGRATVWTGTLEVGELKRDQIRGFGPDFYASQVVRYPLGVRLEPLAAE